MTIVFLTRKCYLENKPYLTKYLGWSERRSAKNWVTESVMVVPHGSYPNGIKVHNIFHLNVFCSTALHRILNILKKNFSF